MKEGDELARRLIQDYWDTLTQGRGPYWDLHDWPLHYTPHDRWATREEWINVAKQCLGMEGRENFALGLLLDEGFNEYLDRAVAVIMKWEPEWDEYYYRSDWLSYGIPPLEPAALDDLIKRLPPDHPIRRKYLPADAPDELDDEARRALISVEDDEFCHALAARIKRVFDVPCPDAAEIEDYALPRMMELGRLCQKYIAPAAMDAAKRFCLEYLERDRELAPHFRQLCEEMSANPKDEHARILWIRDRIAPLAWRIGWLDILTALGDEPWYWNKELWYWDRRCGDWFMERDDLLVWSQFLENDTLRAQARYAMLGEPHGYGRIEGAIAWVRMSQARWPPD